METKTDATQLSAEQLRELLAQAEQAEQEAKQAEAQEVIAELETELAEAQEALKTAKDTQSEKVAEMVKQARKAAKAEYSKIVVEAQERVNQIKNQIREAGGKTTSTGTRTKSKGFGDRDGKATVLAVLGEIDGPATPKQVCERILEDGLYVGKDTSLTVAVSVALNELAQEGEVKKEGQKRGCTFEVA